MFLTLRSANARNFSQTARPLSRCPFAATTVFIAMFRTITIALAAAVLGHASSKTIEGFANTVMQDNFDAGEVRLPRSDAFSVLQRHLCSCGSLVPRLLRCCPS
jgi:hypothetical protein